MLHTDPVPVQCHWSMHILEERSEWRWVLQLPHLHPCELVLWLPLNEVSEVRKCDKMDAGFDELTATCGRTLTTNGEETVHHIVSRGWHYDCHRNSSPHRVKRLALRLPHQHQQWPTVTHLTADFIRDLQIGNFHSNPILNRILNGMRGSHLHVQCWLSCGSCVFNNV